ncbi:hypothetical protein D3C86_2037130 [compost metagenome]
MIVAEASGQDASCLGIPSPLAHLFGIAKSGQPVEQVHKAFAQAPITLPERVTQVLATRLRLSIVTRCLTHGEQQVAQRRCRKEMRTRRSRTTTPG